MKRHFIKVDLREDLSQNAYWKQREEYEKNIFISQNKLHNLYSNH